VPVDLAFVRTRRVQPRARLRKAERPDQHPLVPRARGVGADQRTAAATRVAASRNSKAAAVGRRSEEVEEPEDLGPPTASFRPSPQLNC
jgi:hypothetical protein